MTAESTMGLLERGWASYAEHVLPTNASPIQRQETRRAFYAGAAWLFEGLITGLDEDHEPTEADLGTMDAVVAELRRFRTDVQAGRA